MEGLERMLSFMSEEDRIEALALYEKMFDDADDEASLARSLESPTRQAFVVARAYDANRRRQGSVDDDETPAFVRAILKVYEDSVPLPLAAVSRHALPEPAPLPAVEDGGEPEELPPLYFSFPDDEEAEEELPPRRPVLDDQVTLFDEAPDQSADEGDQLNLFSEDFSLPEEPSALPEPPRGREASPHRKEELRAFVLDDLRPEDVARESITWEHRYGEPEEGTERVTNVPLLILFVILAVPLTLLGVALLLIPTLLALLLAGAAIVGGCAGLTAAFGSFAVFADILIVFGCAVAALALGLLFLWLFIWFVGGPIAGLVRGVIRLGGRWCSKEVPA